MSHTLDSLAEWVRTRPVLLRGARSTVKLIPDIPWTRRIPEIGRLRFRLRQHRWFLWQRFGKNDHFMLGVFDRLIRRGDVVYDIGANIGIYARMMVQWFQASEVIAFEPMSQNVDLLLANVQIGSFPERVRVFALAVGDRDGEADLQIDDVRSTTAVLDSVSDGVASAGRQHFNLPPLTERVQLMRLDTVVRDEMLPPPDVVKIDTEGAEVMVLQGAEATLREHRPRLTIATHGPEIARRTIECLEGLGYVSYGFVEDEGYIRLSPADGERLSNNNIVASMDENDVASALVPKSPSECRRDLS